MVSFIISNLYILQLMLKLDIKRSNFSLFHEGKKIIKKKPNNKMDEGIENIQ